MNKELEALLMVAAKAMGLGVVGVDPKRAEEFGVSVGKLVRKGEPWGLHWQGAPETGFYTASGTDSLTIDAHSPGDGRTRYSVVRLTISHTGYGSFSPLGMTLAECKAFLRGVIVAKAETT